MGEKKKVEKNEQGIEMKPGYIFDPTFGYIPLKGTKPEKQAPEPKKPQAKEVVSKH